MKKILFLLALLTGMASAQLVTLNQAGHWNPITPTDPDVAAAFYNTIITGYQSNPTLYCEVRRNDSPPHLFCYATDALRDGGDTTTALVGLSGGTCLGSVQTSDCSLALTHRTGPSMTVSMQMKKSIAPSEPADLDIGPMNISKINVDSAVAGVVAGVATSISDSLTPFRDGTGHIAVSRVDADSAILRRLEVNNTCCASKLIVDDDGARFPYLGDGPLAQSGGDLTVLGTTGTDDVVLSNGPTVNAPTFTGTTTAQGIVYAQIADGACVGSSGYVLQTSNDNNGINVCGYTNITSAAGSQVYTFNSETREAVLHGVVRIDTAYINSIFASDTNTFFPSIKPDTLAVRYRSTFTYATASTPAYFDASKRLISGSFTGTGTTFALAASPSLSNPTFTGTIAAGFDINGSVHITSSAPQVFRGVAATEVRNSTSDGSDNGYLGLYAGGSDAFGSRGYAIEMYGNEIGGVSGQGKFVTGNNGTGAHVFVNYSGGSQYNVLKMDSLGSHFLGNMDIGSGGLTVTGKVVSADSGRFDLALRTGGLLRVGGASTLVGKVSGLDSVTSALGFRSANYNAGGLTANFGGKILAADSIVAGTGLKGATLNLPNFTFSYNAGELSIVGTSTHGVRINNYLATDGDIAVGGTLGILALTGGGNAYACLDASGNVFRSNSVTCPLVP